MKQQEIVDWAVTKLESYDRDKNIYNISAIILSILDVVCGLITVFYACMLTTSIIASILCGSVWATRFIQIIKAEKLAKALKALKIANAFSLAYIASRKKRSEFMEKTKVRNIAIAVLTVLGFASVIVCNFVPQLAEYVNYSIYYLCALLPVDLYATFNNAKLTAEEINSKAKQKEQKQAITEAKKELAEKQNSELLALAEKKLQEQKNKNIVS